MKKTYFASDFHFGIPDRESSLRRERYFIDWLDYVREDAEEIYLMGDLFDFWYEYGTVVPKGYVRLLGKLAELTDSGIMIHLFRGNHDVWAFRYLEEEVGVVLHRKPITLRLGGRQFYLAHGDGLGPGDRGYKMLKRVFESKVAQWMFKWLHPDVGSRIALYFSLRSRLANIAREGKLPENPVPEDEMLYHYSRKTLEKHPEINFFIFGHRHIPMDIKVGENTRCIILGDWLVNFTYAVYDNNDVELKSYKDIRPYGT